MSTDPVPLGRTDGTLLAPGGVLAAPGELELNAGRERRTLRVENTGDRPIQVGSHFHFADTNGALAFDRHAAVGFRLDVPAGTGIRFEPGLPREVDLVRLGGAGVVPGLQRGKAGATGVAATATVPGADAPVTGASVTGTSGSDS